MATSSITHNFVVSNPNSVKRFVAAIDEADRDRTPKQTLPGRQLTNPWINSVRGAMRPASLFSSTSFGMKCPSSAAVRSAKRGSLPWRTVQF